MTASAADRAALVERWYAEGRYGPETLGALVAEGVVEGRLLFSRDDGGREVTAEAVVEHVRLLAAGLRAHGVGAGDPVAVQVPSSPEAFALIGAIWLVGGVVLPVVDSAGPNELRFILHQSGARAVAAATSWRGRSGVDDVRAAGFDGLVVAVGTDVPADATSLADLGRHGQV
ncbi:MAG TPA: AMP-binding protein, partial [Acidimicrobiales bacterium]|nr:AMP-binding protein [Acidimicrobiales bacterium]